MGVIEFNIEELKGMKKYPKNIYYKGNLELLKRRKVSIVGTRKPISYTKDLTAKLSNSLSKNGICIVSGGAIGVDTIAHKNSNFNTIMVSPMPIDIRYPKINDKLIENMEKNSLVLSMFDPFKSTSKANFVTRNEMVVALGEVLVITQADLNSGSLRSANYALAQNRDIYVLMHRSSDSSGTKELLKKSLAKPIYDIDEFVSMFSTHINDSSKGDEFLEFCKINPSYDDVFKKFGNIIVEYELDGKIVVENSTIRVL